MTTTEDHSGYFAGEAVMTSNDGVRMEGNRYVLPTNDGLDGKWHPHTRVTAISDVLPSKYGLGLWAADRVVWAMAQRPDLCALLASVPVDDVKTIREVRAKAEVVSAMDEGANLGIATHNVLARYSAGEPIDTLHRMFHPDIRAFQAKLDECGLTVVPGLIERVVRMRDYDIAGRLDYIMAERDGTFVVVDVKTKGDPEKVHEIATQLAPYACADEMFDPVTGRYAPMPPVRRDYALMIHIHPGSGAATVKKINIRIGLWSVEVAKNALAYAKMTHLATPYTPPGPVKPADHDTMQRVSLSGLVHAPAKQPEHPVREQNGQPDPQHVADVANAVLDESHARVGSREQHGVVVPDTGPVPAPNPATYGAPAGVEPPAAYVPQTIAPRADAVLMTTGEGGIEDEAKSIEIVFKNKSKAQMQAYARRYKITDLNHHKIHIATSIATVRADRRKAGLDPEPSEEGDAAPQLGTVRKPQTLAESGFDIPGAQQQGTPVPAPQPQPVADRPVVDASEQAVLADIAKAQTVQEIGRIWTLWTGTYGPESWRGNVAAAADAKVAALRAGPSAGGVNEPPF